MPTQRNIRKLPSRASQALDEQTRTIQWVLVVWAVLVTAMIVLLGGWNDPRPLFNGWVRLIGLLATWGMLAWLATKPGKWMAQRLRLGVAASLVLHTVLAFLLVIAHLTFQITEPEPNVDRKIVMQPEEVPKVVEVVRPQQDEQAYEKPVATDHLAQQVQSQARQEKSDTLRKTNEAPETPELASTDLPQSMLERRPRTALAHRAESPGERSRQTELAAIATTAPEPLVRPQQATTTPSVLPSPDARLAKSESQPTSQEVTEPTGSSSEAPSATARRENTDAPKVARTPPTPRRSQSPAEVVEPTVASVAPSVTTPETNRLAADPSRLERPRAATAALEDVPEPQQQRDTPPTAIARRDTREPEMPLAAAPTPLDRRNQVDVAEAIEVAPTSKTQAERTRTAANREQPAEPVAARVGKQESRQPQLADVSEAMAEDVSSPSPSTQPIRRATKSIAAATTPTQNPTSNTASESLAEISAESPDPLMAAVPRETTQTPSTSPAPRVLADSRGGTGARGDGLNNVSDTPAASSRSAPFASTSARRRRSTQTERGPALAPNPVAEVAKGRAAATTPQSTLAAIPTPRADVAGSATPDPISASSSAAADRQFSNATLGDLTAAKGEAEFDTGPPQVAPERGSGRGAMGGRLAMRAPQTSRGLGPRRVAQAAMAPSSTAFAPVSAAAGGAAPAVAAIDRAETQPGGTLEPSTAGRPGRADTPRLAQARAPSGAMSGGGSSPPAVGPTPTASSPGIRPSRAGGSIARSRSATGRGAGPTIALPSPSSGPSGGGRAADAASAVVANVELPTQLMPNAGSGESQNTPVAPATQSVQDIAPKRPALLAADLGDGGIASEPSLDAGIPQRVARRQARALRMTPSRFTSRREGGDPSPPGRRRNPAPAFASRTDRTDAAPITSPTDPRPKTEAAIELGLEFLAKLQREDGSWSLGDFGDLPVADEEQPSIRADGAATGLVLLAFLGGGYDHYDDKYRTVVQRGIDYLVRQQSDRGDIFPERDLPGPRATRFYSHGIAALALCEAYGMTGDPELQAPAQAALNYISDVQHPQYHGWRYVEGTNSDLSVTGWQVMALRSGELAGLEVNPSTYRRVAQFVEKCRAGNGAMYCYNPYVTSTREGMKHYGKPSTVMTSVGMLMKFYLGENRDSSLMQQGADHLAENLPTQSGPFRSVPVGTPRNPQRDTYYWYYATQVMFHMGGEYWQAWHEHLHPLLVDHQTLEGPLAGSWNPQKPVPDMWGNHGGRLYVTCLNLLSLEVSYRHLPLYEMTGK